MLNRHYLNLYKKYGRNMARPKKTEITTKSSTVKLKPETKNSEEQVQARVWDLAEKIASSGWTRMDVIKYVKDNYGLGDVQAKR